MPQISAHYASRETGQIELHADGTGTVLNVPWSTDAFRYLDRVELRPSSAGICPTVTCSFQAVGNVVEPVKGRNTFWIRVKAGTRRAEVARQLGRLDPDLRAAWPGFAPTLGRISTTRTREELQAALRTLGLLVEIS